MLREHSTKHKSHRSPNVWEFVCRRFSIWTVKLKDICYVFCCTIIYHFIYFNDCPKAVRSPPELRYENELVSKSINYVDFFVLWKLTPTNFPCTCTCKIRTYRDELQPHGGCVMCVCGLIARMFAILSCHINQNMIWSWPISVIALSDNLITMKTMMLCICLQQNQFNVSVEYNSV